MGFSRAVVERLVREGQIELVASSEERVVQFVAAALGGAHEGSSLISTLARALLACPDVDELYLDNVGLKELVGDLKT